MTLTVLSWLKIVGCLQLKLSSYKNMMYTITHPHHTLTLSCMTDINMCTFSGSESSLAEETTGNIHKRTTTRCVGAERHPTQMELSATPLCFCTAMTRQSSINLPAPHIGKWKHRQWRLQCSNQSFPLSGLPSNPEPSGVRHYRGPLRLMSILKWGPVNSIFSSQINFRYTECKHWRSAVVWRVSEQPLVHDYRLF